MKVMKPIEFLWCLSISVSVCGHKDKHAEIDAHRLLTRLYNKETYCTKGFNITVLSQIWSFGSKYIF